MVEIVARDGLTQIEKFAVKELASYIGAMTDGKTDVVNTSPGNAIYVGSLPNWASSGEKERMANTLSLLHKDGFIIRNIDNALVIQETGLTIPDPDIYARPFVSVPLAELCPDGVLPDTGIPVGRVAKGETGGALTALDHFTSYLKGIIQHERETHR